MEENKINCDLQLEDFIYDIVDGKAVITEYRGGAETLYVPSHINGYKVVGFDVYDFCSEEASCVRHVILPGTIEQFDFWKLNLLQTVRIESGCKSIPDRAFAGLKNLKLVDLPDTVKVIGREAFAYCESLRYVRIPEACAYIGEEAFAYSGVSNIFIPEAVEKIGKNPFCGCVALSIHLHPENRNYALTDGMVLYTADYSRLIWCHPCYPKILEVPEELISVDSMALMGCQLYGFNIPEICKAFDGMELKYYLM